MVSVSRFGVSAEIPAAMPLNELCMKLPRIDILQWIAGKEGSGDPVLRKALGSG